MMLRKLRKSPAAQPMRVQLVNDCGTAIPMRENSTPSMAVPLLIPARKSEIGADGDYSNTNKKLYAKLESSYSFQDSMVLKRVMWN